MRSRMLPVLLVVVVVVAAALLFGRGDGRVGGPPLDPRSTFDDGTRAAVLLLEDQGRNVTVGGFDPDDPVTVVFDDDLDADQRQRIEDYVEAGGTAVMLGRTDLVDVIVATATVDTSGGCVLDPLEGVDELDIGLARGLAGSPESSCFPVGDGWLVTVMRRGAGQIVAVGSARAFTNSRLARADHAAFVVGVIGLADGATTIVPPGRFSAVGEGDKSLIELIGEPVWAALAALAMVLVAYGLHHSRRLGPPVSEHDPVEISATELVTATARLYDRTKARSLAATHLRRQIDDDLQRRWRLAPGSDPELVVARLRVHGADADDVRRALSNPIGLSDDDHVETIAAIIRARRLIGGSRHSTTSKTTV